jgi:hypothetical protein
MKKVFAALSIIFTCSQVSFSQQVINTNKKATCTYSESSPLQGCIEESLNTIFTFKENLKTIIHQINGMDQSYNIIEKVYEHPYWIYRVSDSEGVTFDLKSNQTAKEFYFYPAVLVSGASVSRYTFN